MNLNLASLLGCLLLCLFLTSCVQASVTVDDCGPRPSLTKKQCLSLEKKCFLQLRIVLKWTGEGTINKATGHLEGDGGCQCDQYCGYHSPKPCKRDKMCFWNKKAGICYSKETQQPGHQILSCPLQTNSPFTFAPQISTPHPSTQVPSQSPSKVPSLSPGFTHAPSTQVPSLNPAFRAPSNSPRSPSSRPSSRPSSTPSSSPSVSTTSNIIAPNLGTAANYVILSESGITNVAPSKIIGNMGVSPIAASSMTGFALIMDPSGTFSRSNQVVGDVYAADYGQPTPANLGVAILDMETAYTYAAGVTPPNFVNLESGNLGGLTLVPGVYSWSTDVIIPSTVILSGGTNDVWIFQISGTLKQASTTSVLLTGGAQAQNVFWQVAQEVSILSDANFQGIILGYTEIVFGTGATLVGRALAQTAVTLIMNTITSP